MTDIPKTVISIFSAFGAKKVPNIRLTKIGCTGDREPKIPIGQVVEGVFAGSLHIGNSFNIAHAIIKEGGNHSEKNRKGTEYTYWCTSIIQKILPNNTFETKNSIYRWEVIH